MKRRRGLSGGEDELWRKATRDVRPLPKKPPETPRPGPTIGETSRRDVAPVRSRASAATPETRAGAKTKSPFAAGDPALEKKARRGRIEVERTLDLHGLREAAAEMRLKSFLQQASRDGCRCVLVITGKGSGSFDIDPFAAVKPRGVIRARFQQWIAEEPLRSLISRAAQAQPRHGGSGAFYVFLKNRSGKR